jgi:branched-chain amino acid transport system substrate-binding protein
VQHGPCFHDQLQIYSPYADDATLVRVDAMKRAKSVEPRAYLPFVGKRSTSA